MRETKFGLIPMKNGLEYGVQPELRIQAPKGLYHTVMKRSSDCLGLMCIFSPCSTLLDYDDERLMVRHVRAGVGHQEIIPYYQLVNFIKSFILHSVGYYREYVKVSNKAEFQAVLYEYVKDLGFPTVFDDYLMMYTRDLTVLHKSTVAIKSINGLGFYPVHNTLWSVPKVSVPVDISKLECVKVVEIDIAEDEAVVVEVEKQNHDLLRVSLSIGEETSELSIVEHDFRTSIINVPSFLREYGTTRIRFKFWLLTSNINLNIYKGHFPEMFYAIQKGSSLYVQHERLCARMIFNYNFTRVPCTKHPGQACGLYIMHQFCLKDLLDPGEIVLGRSVLGQVYRLSEIEFLRFLFPDFIDKDSSYIHPLPRRKI